MNKHKFRIFFENFILILIVLAILYYIVIFTISVFNDNKIKLPSFDFNVSMPIINTNYFIDIIKKEQKVIILNEFNTSDDINTSTSMSDVNKSISSVIELIDKNITKKFKLNDTNLSIKNITFRKKEKEQVTFDKNITVIKKIPIKPIVKIDKKITKEDMLKELRAYIKSTIIDVRSNKNNIINLSKEESSIKIRITVFKDGKYKKLTYIAGNKSLINKVKLALNKTFPKEPNNIIKSQFPRYLRFKIDFSK